MLVGLPKKHKTKNIIVLFLWIIYNAINSGNASNKVSKATFVSLIKEV